VILVGDFLMIVGLVISIISLFLRGRLSSFIFGRYGTGGGGLDRLMQVAFT
jgi:hypothetical protein